jgi:hypothetical protein
MKGKRREMRNRNVNTLKERRKERTKNEPPYKSEQ